MSPCPSPGTAAPRSWEEEEEEEEKAWAGGTMSHPLTGRRQQGTGDTCVPTVIFLTATKITPPGVRRLHGSLGGGGWAERSSRSHGEPGWVGGTHPVTRDHPGVTDTRGTPPPRTLRDGQKGPPGGHSDRWDLPGAGWTAGRSHGSWSTRGAHTGRTSQGPQRWVGPTPEMGGTPHPWTPLGGQRGSPTVHRQKDLLVTTE